MFKLEHNTSRRNELRKRDDFNTQQGIIKSKFEIMRDLTGWWSQELHNKNNIIAGKNVPITLVPFSGVIP